MSNRRLPTRRERSSTGQGRRPLLRATRPTLGSERGPNGEPTATDFLLADLPPIAERFSTAFEELIMPNPDRPDYRAALSTGILVPRVLVTGVLDSDGGVTLLSVRMDFDAAW